MQTGDITTEVQASTTITMGFQSTSTKTGVVRMIMRTKQRTHMAGLHLRKMMTNQPIMRFQNQIQKKKKKG